MHRICVEVMPYSEHSLAVKCEQQACLQLELYCVQQAYAEVKQAQGIHTCLDHSRVQCKSSYALGTMVNIKEGSESEAVQHSPRSALCLTHCAKDVLVHILLQFCP